MLRQAQHSCIAEFVEVCPREGILSRTEGWFVYIIECSDKSLYTGVTSDIKRRLKEHNSGKGSRYTKARAPVTLVYSEVYKAKSEAMSREIQLKGWIRAKKKVLIEKDYEKLKKLSRGFRS